DILDIDARRALADVDQTRFVTIDERPQEHDLYDAEHSRVSADAQREGHDDCQCQPLGARERPECKFQVGDEIHTAPIQLAGDVYVQGYADRISLSRVRTCPNQLWIEAKYGSLQAT